MNLEDQAKQLEDTQKQERELMIEEHESDIENLVQLHEKEIQMEASVHDAEMNMLLERRLLNSVLDTVVDGNFYAHSNSNYQYRPHWNYYSI